MEVEWDNAVPDGDAGWAAPEARVTDSERESLHDPAPCRHGDCCRLLPPDAAVTSDRNSSDCVQSSPNSGDGHTDPDMRDDAVDLDNVETGVMDRSVSLQDAASGPDADNTPNSRPWCTPST